jgi:hypothetical protein
MDPKHQSPEEYAHDLISSIIEIEKNIPENEQLPIKLLSYWIDGIKKSTQKTWAGYIVGDRESYLLTEDEMMTLYDKAGEQYVSELLDGMVDKDLLEVSVDENGEFLYGLTELGKKISKDL